MNFYRLPSGRIINLAHVIDVKWEERPKDDGGRERYLRLKTGETHFYITDEGDSEFVYALLIAKCEKAVSNG